MGRVSAIVSAYFCSDFLKARLDNLEALDPRPQVIVVCHDGSQEWNIAVGYGLMTKVTTLDIPAWGAAINQGIEWACGDYLTVANSDDLFYIDGLNAMSDYLDAHPDVGIVHGDCDIQNELGIHPWKRPGESVSLNACRVGPMPMWRKSLHKEYGWFDETFQVAADYDFWLRCATRGVRVAHIDKAVGLYALRENSLEHRNQTALAAENAEIRRRYADR